MTRQVLLDTGPLVALLDRRDSFFDWATEHLHQLSPPLLTCEPVITEACFLVRHLADGIPTVLELLQRGFVKIDFRLDSEVETLLRLTAKYADVPMSLADACLVRMSELHPQSVVWTLDADFRRYRRKGRRVIPLMIPDDHQ